MYDIYSQTQDRKDVYYVPHCYNIYVLHHNTYNAYNILIEQHYTIISRTRIHTMIRLLCVLLSIMQSSALDYSWQRLHTVRSSQELKQAVEDYLYNFPCEDCKDHFQDLVNTHPFPLSEVTSVEDARIWTWLTHNMVNQRLEKKWEPFEIMYTY